MKLLQFSGALGEFNDWCGMSDIPKLVSHRSDTQEKLKPIVDELEESILERMSATPERAVLSKLFLVPKSAEGRGLFWTADRSTILGRELATAGLGGCARDKTEYVTSKGGR